MQKINYLAWVHWHFDGEDDTLLLDVAAENDAAAEHEARNQARRIFTKDVEIFAVTLDRKTNQ